MQKLRWWQEAVFYQIYPRSFADGNGDGIGDFQGMTSRLDYLQELGIDAVWLSPHYPSPQLDCGYDISDYTGVNPEYGSLEEFRRFLEGAHKRGIRVILDMVLNHTSDQHPWFIESRSSRNNANRDWYVWRNGRGNGPPNNWNAGFGGPAWEYDAATRQYYYHYFFKEQPDLNWRNPEVKKAMFDAVRFWLDMGVDGYRLDIVGTIYEDPKMPDHSAEISQTELYLAQLRSNSPEERRRLREQREAMFCYQREQPGIHELMRELRAVIDEYPERMTVGETSEIEYYGDGGNEFHLIFNFPLMRRGRLTPGLVRANQQERLASMPQGAWPCNTLGNHDSPRVYNQFGDGRNDEAQARISLALMLTLRGTPFLYNGEEIGMTDLMLGDISQIRDMLGVWMYRTMIDQMGVAEREALAYANRFGRDKCRTPMQWDNVFNAGFSPPGVKTWLPVNPDYARGINVADQWDDAGSLLSFYRRMLRMRRQTPALRCGDFTVLHEDAKDYLAFTRHSQGDGQTCLVVLNMSRRSHKLNFNLATPRGRIIFSSHHREGETDDLSQIAIAPFEIYIAETEGI